MQSFQMKSFAIISHHSKLGLCLFAEMVTGGRELDVTEHDEVEARLRLVLRAVLLVLDVGEAARGIREAEGT